MAGKRQNVFVEVEKLETLKSSSTDAKGIIGVLAWSMCVHVRRRRFVAKKEATLVANVKHYAMMRAM